MKIQLKGREIPRTSDGDPAFKVLVNEGTLQTLTIEQKMGDTNVFKSVLETFTPEEVVELVNRAIYQLEYQHASHKRRGQEMRDREKAVREKVKQLFHTSWMKATPEQIRRATEEVEKG